MAQLALNVAAAVPASSAQTVASTVVGATSSITSTVTGVEATDTQPSGEVATTVNIAPSSARVGVKLYTGPLNTPLLVASNHSKVEPAISELAVKVIGAPSQTGPSIDAPAIGLGQT